jgi:hypothetical protein
MLVSASYVIPSDDKSWPEKTWGLKLGGVVSKIRSGHRYKDKRKGLISIGFDYSPQSTARGYDVAELALLRYKEMYGHMLVPQSYVVPNDDESWPKETWGMKLGGVVSNIRSGNSYKDKRQELMSIGFDYSLQSTSQNYAAAESALLRYKDMYGDMLVPCAFTIPYDDDSWPEETWGLRLGGVVSKIRGGRSYKDKRQELINIGFDFNPQSNGPYGYAATESALLRYKDMYGDMLVPYAFIIPYDDDSWPQETWGMKLGQLVNSIRSGHSYKDKRKELMSIGFDYSLQSTARGYAAADTAPIQKKNPQILKPGHFRILRSRIVRTKSVISSSKSEILKSSS